MSIRYYGYVRYTSVQSINQSIYQLTNQSINQSINQSSKQVSKHLKQKKIKSEIYYVYARSINKNSRSTRANKAGVFAQTAFCL
jgi:hypothetical protein